jgi:hypothetical protein
MFVYSGPDFVPQVLHSWIKTAESGIFSDASGTKYCVINLFSNNGRRKRSLINVVLTYNRVLPVDQRIVLYNVDAITAAVAVAQCGETLQQSVVCVKKGQSHPIMGKCLLDKQHAHPAYRRWVNPVAPVGQ